MAMGGGGGLIIIIIITVMVMRRPLGASAGAGGRDGIARRGCDSDAWHRLRQCGVPGDGGWVMCCEDDCFPGRLLR
jgi:hypothetical protein